MGKYSKELAEFMKKFGINDNEVWAVPGGKEYAVKHTALERVAAQQGITIDMVDLVHHDLANGVAIVKAAGKVGDDRRVMTYGSVTPKNCRNAYTVEMAEKRAVDRVIKKLLLAPAELFGEDEADNFKEPEKRQNPHVTRAEDIFEETTTDIPVVPVARMKVKDARQEYDVMLKEMRRIDNEDDLKEWGEARAETINSFPPEWIKMFRGEYANHKKSLNQPAEAAE